MIFRCNHKARGGVRYVRIYRNNTLQLPSKPYNKFYVTTPVHLKLIVSLTIFKNKQFIKDNQLYLLSHLLTASSAINHERR